MRPYATVFLVACCYLTAFSPCLAQDQAVVYESFAVDTAASPRGGAGMLEAFLKINLRKPFPAKIAGISGKVYVKAVVEPTGRVSDVTVIRGLRPDCDREAVRAFGLFSGWAPARKAGRAVRQVLTYPVFFEPNQPLNYRNGQLTAYFDQKNNALPTVAAARRKQVIPVDSLTGWPTGEMTIVALNGTDETPEGRIPLERITLMPKNGDADTLVALGHRQANMRWYGPFYKIDKKGNLRAVDNATTGEAVYYNRQGMVTGAETSSDGVVSRLTWHPSGLLSQVEKWDKNAPSVPDVNNYRLMSAWDSTGQPTIQQGNGLFRSVIPARSRGGSGRVVQFLESGTYQNGLKTGQWQGVYTDSSYLYQETYNAGKPLGGTATIANKPPLRYRTAEQNPEFDGGPPAMYRFLSKTISFPKDAIRNNVGGKVFIAFTVCEDGTLCDYEVRKGVYPSIDSEALRVVKEMSGKWKPGLYRGEPVRVKYNMPISFDLQ